MSGTDFFVWFRIQIKCKSGEVSMVVKTAIMTNILIRSQLIMFRLLLDYLDIANSFFVSTPTCSPKLSTINSTNPCNFRKDYVHKHDTLS